MVYIPASPDESMHQEDLLFRYGPVFSAPLNQATMPAVYIPDESMHLPEYMPGFAPVATAVPRPSVQPVPVPEPFDDEPWYEEAFDWGFEQAKKIPVLPGALALPGIEPDVGDVLEFAGKAEETLPKVPEAALDIATDWGPIVVMGVAMVALQMVKQR